MKNRRYVVGAIALGVSMAAAAAAQGPPAQMLGERKVYEGSGTSDPIDRVQVWAQVIDRTMTAVWTLPAASANEPPGPVPMSCSTVVWNSAKSAFDINPDIRAYDDRWRNARPTNWDDKTPSLCARTTQGRFPNNPTDICYNDIIGKCVKTVSFTALDRASFEAELAAQTDPLRKDVAALNDRNDSLSERVQALEKRIEELSKP